MSRLMRIRSLLFLGIFALSTFAIERLCHKATDGFMLRHVHTSLSFHPEWEMQDAKCKEEVSTILTQPFHYMGKGAQTYVLISSDGKYILKLFKFHHLKEEEIGNLFASYKLAFDEIQHETGLMLVHLNSSTHLQTQISVIDRLGIAHQLNADTTPFILQRHATLVIPTLEEMRLQKDLQGAKNALSALLNLGKYLEKQKIYDHDAHLSKNYGFIDNHPILFDCGNLSKLSHPQTFKAGSLREWLAKNWPELSSWFENRERSLQ
ncbi:MAG: hypothetical protein ACHQT8_03890 [Chlamydiales bacterium]